MQPAKNFVHYAAFVAMFPHLIAGPIVRYADIDTAARAGSTPRLTAGLAGLGHLLLRCGLAKKLLFADPLAPYVDRLFGAPRRRLGLAGGWAASLGYALQLYFDFSGYSDMAVGLAFLLGFRFPQNFDSPYKAREHLRLLAALAHVAVLLVARLPVHPARRLADGQPADAAATWSW